MKSNWIGWIAVIGIGIVLFSGYSLAKRDKVKIEKNKK